MTHPADGPGHLRALAKATLVGATTAVPIAVPSLPNGFVYDDVWIVEHREVVHRFHLAELVTAPFWPPDRGGVMWRPVSLTAFAVQWMVGAGGIQSGLSGVTHRCRRIRMRRPFSHC